MAQKIDEKHLKKYRILALEMIGLCVVDLCRVMQQVDEGQDVTSTLGGISVGLEKAAAYIRGEKYEVQVAIQHASIKPDYVAPPVADLPAEPLMNEHTRILLDSIEAEELAKQEQVFQGEISDSISKYVNLRIGEVPDPEPITEYIRVDLIIDPIDFEPTLDVTGIPRIGETTHDQ